MIAVATDLPLHHVAQVVCVLVRQVIQAKNVQVARLDITNLDLIAMVVNYYFS